MITKLFKINKKNFLNSLKSFVGLAHRHENFFKIGNCTFINDQKQLLLSLTKYALKSNDNIIWIVGGQLKKMINKY